MNRAAIFGLVSAIVFTMAGCVSEGPLATREGPEPTVAEPVADCREGEAESSCASLILPGWPFGPPGDAIYEAPNDPFPLTSGIWLGDGVTPTACMSTLSPVPVVDSDRDNLSDHCELELARAFAPTMSFSIENCESAEPHWAAKVFSSLNVRIAYLPAYYNDCGSTFGIGDHLGDAEWIMVEIGFNAHTKHWQFRRMWLTAHYGTWFERSTWVNFVNAEFPIRSLAHPRVWVAKDKHSNFKSKYDCSVGNHDVCDWPSYARTIRFPVLANRNIGSLHQRLRDCVPSTVFNPGSGRSECFWTSRPFQGWNPPALALVEDVAPPYAGQIISRFFNERTCLPGEEAYAADCVGDGWEAGYVMAPPQPPPDPNPVLSLSGPSLAIDEMATVSATVISGSPTTGLHYTWSYLACQWGQPCSTEFISISEGIDLLSAEAFVSSYDIWVDVQVELRLTPSAAPIRTQTFRVEGIGAQQSPCYPQDCSLR